MIRSHFKRLSAGASPRFDGVPIPFLVYACLPIERGRKVNYVDVLMPLIERMMIAVIGMMYRTYANVLKDYFKTAETCCKKAQTAAFT
eukprot:scaffold60961_cov15-Tisochrysis_lutea.AAC.1